MNDDHHHNVSFFEYDNVEEWARAGATTLAAALERDLALHPRTRLMLSGGSTPAPVYKMLARTPLHWAQVDVGLVDERWLQPDDPDSNAHLIRGTLMVDKAADARFQPLTRPGRSIEDAVSAANLLATQPIGALTLGMGEDGHTASLFPGMRGLDEALASTQAYVAVDGSGCGGAGKWLRRISMTPAGIAPAASRLLLIRGAAKRELFKRALAGNDPRELPVRIGFMTPGAHLHVHWCL